MFWKKGVWVEVTTLIIPGYNDSLEQLQEIAQFVASVSRDIPWHVSAFYPRTSSLMCPALALMPWRRGH